MMAQRILKIMNVALARSEHENITRATVMTRMNHQLGTARATAVGMSTFGSRESFTSGADDNAS